MGLFKSKEVVGVDIGTHSIKVVELRWSGKSIQLQSFGIAPIPAQSIVDGAILDKGAIVDALQGLLREQKVRRKQTAMGLSGHSVIVKKISLPEMTEPELEESIHWEAEQYIPFDIDDVNLDFQIIEGGSSEEGKMDVLLVAAKKDKIDDYTDLLIQAGLQPTVVDLDAFALQNAWEINYEVAPGQNVALVNIGAGFTNICVLRNGMTSFTRDISIGGNNYTDAVQKELAMSAEQAERVKTGEEAAPSPEELRRVMDTVSENVAVEVQRSFDFFRATTADQDIHQVLLSGGSARVGGLDTFLAQRLRTQVAVFDPFQNIKVNPKKFDPDYLKEHGPAAAVAVGLALRKAGDR
ncbi:MAG TPA: type IV pilus assembly protein PilM [bacterium]